jgi:hypothetical protein
MLLGSDAAAPISSGRFDVFLVIVEGMLLVSDLERIILCGSVHFIAYLGLYEY